MQFKKETPKVERVYLETPYAGDIERNLEYARDCMFDCLARGEAPFASHLLYTQKGILCDEIPAERELGMKAGFTWARAASKSVFYVDLGISGGMLVGFEQAQRQGRAVEFRSLSKWQRFHAKKFPKGILNPLQLIDFFY